MGMGRDSGGTTKPYKADVGKCALMAVRNVLGSTRSSSVADGPPLIILIRLTLVIDGYR